MIARAAAPGWARFHGPLGVSFPVAGLAGAVSAGCQCPQPLDGRVDVGCPGPSGSEPEAQPRRLGARHSGIGQAVTAQRHRHGQIGSLDGRSGDVMRLLPVSLERALGQLTTAVTAPLLLVRQRQYYCCGSGSSQHRHRPAGPLPRSQAAGQRPAMYRSKARKLRFRRKCNYAACTAFYCPSYWPICAGANGGSRCRPGRNSLVSPRGATFSIRNPR